MSLSKFDLSQLGEVDLKRVVEKFDSVTTGGRFYRSSKGARDFVDGIKPAWPLPHTASYLFLDDQKMQFSRERRLPTSDDWSKFLLSFCRFEAVAVGLCTADYIQTVVVSDIEAMGVVEKITIGRFGNDRDPSDETVRLLLKAAKPGSVGVYTDTDDPASACYEGVKHLHLQTRSLTIDDVSYWATDKLFDLMANRRTIIGEYQSLHKKAVISFLENWLAGKPTSSLEKLTYQLERAKLEVEVVEEVLNDPDLQSRMHSCVKDADDWSIERDGPGKLHVHADYEARKIDFNFL